MSGAVLFVLAVPASKVLTELVLQVQYLAPLPRYVQETTYPVSDTYQIRIRQGYAGDTYPPRIGVLGHNGP